jgi:hypothetical protein
MQPVKLVTLKAQSYRALTNLAAADYSSMLITAPARLCALAYVNQVAGELRRLAQEAFDNRNRNGNGNVNSDVLSGGST